jgi:flagellar biosynthesis/type III secretory pathway protein FliH
VTPTQHRIRFSEPLREVRVRTGEETFVSQSSVKGQLEERYRAGIEAGQRALSEELVRQRTQLLEIQNNILRSIERSLPTVAAQCEKELVQMVMEVARRVVGDLPISAEAVESVVKRGIAVLHDAAEYEVRLNPEDLALLQKIQSSVLPTSANDKVRFVAERTVSRGGCVIHTHHGLIELNREKMFQKLEEAALC